MLFCCTLALMSPTSLSAQDNKRQKLPNILWITSEDHGPHMGCYGDTFATTPNIDKLAKKGMIYHALLVKRPGLRSGPHHHHHRPLSAVAPAPSTCAA